MNFFEEANNKLESAINGKIGIECFDNWAE